LTNAGASAWRLRFVPYNALNINGKKQNFVDTLRASAWTRRPLVSGLAEQS
jgi:hypothetical protein